MKILVVVASKHHATEEIGDVIVEELRASGHGARRVAPQDVRSLGGVDAVVVGSAVYMTQWMESMRVFVADRAEELRRLPVWVFSCGLAGVGSGAVQDPASASTVVRQLDPVAWTTFRGRLDPAGLGLRERTVTREGVAPEGDYREWDKIRAWARAVAAEADRREAGAEPRRPGLDRREAEQVVRVRRAG